MLTGYICNIGVGKDFVYQTLKVYWWVKKRNEFVYIRIKEFCASKGCHDRMGECI